MAFNTGERELVMASPSQAGDTANDVTLTITASEPGILDLDRLVLQVSIDEAEIQGTDFADQGFCTGLLVQNSLQLIRGRNNPEAPTQVWSGTRGISGAMPLGRVTLETGDTIAAGYHVDGTDVDYTATLGAPFLPRNSRGMSLPVPNWQPVYAASPATAIAAAGNGTITITFDEDGIMDLTSLQMGGLNATANIGNGTYKDATGLLQVTSLALPSSNEIIVGQNTPVAPGTMWGANRSYTWAAFGSYAVSAGSTLVATVSNAGVDVVNASLGLRFFPQGGPALR